MAVPERRTTDGFEMQIGTNHLGHFALDQPAAARRSATAWSSSPPARTAWARSDLDDLNWEQRGYQRWRAYGQSKLANLLFTFELQRRLDEAGSDVRAVAAHPGYAATNLQSHTGNVRPERADGDRQPADRPERRDGRAADALRRDAGPPRRHLRRPRRLRASSAATRRSSAAAAPRSDARDRARGCGSSPRS